MDEEKPVLKLAIVSLVVVGALVFGFTWLFKSGDSVNAPGKAQINPWAQQQTLAREAMQMAREAQQMQREQMELHRREMEMYEGEMYGEFPAEGEFESE